MSTRQKITLQPDVLRWARERAALSQEDLAKKLRIKPEHIVGWEQSGQISFAQIRRLAARTHTPLGFLFLSVPPEIGLPIADFRVRSGQSPKQPSPELLETVFLMQARQGWMQEDLQGKGASPLAFVGSCQLDSTPQAVAAKIREVLCLHENWAHEATTWSRALAYLRDQIEVAGVLVVINGIVGNNTHRKLDPNEFQGFALADAYAPLIFVNGADFKAAQIFTLIHEFTHLLVAESGVSCWDGLQSEPNDNVIEDVIERFCNRAATEFLVPQNAFLPFWRGIGSDQDPYQKTAQHFRVSSLVVARRAQELDLIDQHTFLSFYREYTSQIVEDNQKKQSGGDFWNTRKSRIGWQFAAAVVRAVYEERLPYREAYALTGLHGETFDKLADKLDIRL